MSSASGVTSGGRWGARPRYRDLPLFWKLLVPYVILLVVAAVIGALLIVRDLNSRAQTTINQQLSDQLLSTRSQLHDDELYLIESTDFAANLTGVAGAVAQANPTQTARLLESVLALKIRLNLLVATDRRGVGIVEFARSPQLVKTSGSSWLDYPGFRSLLTSTTGAARAAIFHLPGRPMVVVAAPICAIAQGCHPTGIALAGISVDALESGLRLVPGAELTLYDAANEPLGDRGVSLPRPPTAAASSAQLPRVTTKVSGRLTQVAYSPYALQGQQVGTLAVALPVAPAFASARTTAHTFAWLLLGIIAGIVGIGLLVNQRVMAQVRPLVATNRRLGAGDLSARAPVRSGDELGELAEGVNSMAEQLEASVETLRSGVEQRTDEVRRLLHERTEFFATLSHEFRTPLAIIRTQAGMLADPDLRHDRAAAAASVEIVSEAASQALDLVNDVLEASRSDAETIDLQLEPVDVSSLLAVMRPTFDGLSAGAGLACQVSVDDPPTVLADARRLRQVLLNLVDNAVKYTASGGRVTISAGRSAGGGAVIVVADSGIGIPADALTHVFDSFYRVPGNAPQHGEGSSGLGLSLAKRLVDAHGGTLDAVSTPGRGTSFTISLPPTQTGGRRGRRTKSTAATA